MALPGYTDWSDEWARLWYMDDTDTEVLLQRMILDKIDAIIKKPGDFFANMVNIGSISDVKPRWVEELDYPDQLVGDHVTAAGTTTLTVTGNLFNVAPTRANIVKCVRPYATLQTTIVGVDYNAEISSVHATNPTMVIVGTGGSSLPADDTDVTWTITGQPFTDADDADDDRILDRYTRFTTSQIFSDTFRIEKTRENIKTRLIGNEVEHQIEAIVRRMRREMHYGVMRMPPVVSGGVPQSMFETQRPRLCGLLWWANYLFGTGGELENDEIYVNLGAGLTKDDIDSVARALFLANADFSDGWQIWCHPLVRDVIQSYDNDIRRISGTDTTVGYGVDNLRLNVGTIVPIKQDRLIPTDCLILANMANMQYGFFQGDEISREELPHGGRYRRWQISAQMVGAIPRMAPVSLGVIRGITT